MSAKINFLLASPSPRDIREVYDALKACPYDRLYAKYFPEIQAYNLMRQYFLARPQYTHLIICPDDLLIKKENVERLAELLKEHDYDNLAGVCNVDLGENKDLLNVTTNLPHPTRTVPERGIVGWRFYDWIRRDKRYEEKITTVPFSGFAAQAINRRTVEKFKFQDDSKFNGTPDLMTGAIDVMWANQCATSKPPIKQHVDMSNRMKHLKLQSKFWDIQLGDGEIRLYPKGKDMYEMIYKEPLGKKKIWNMSKGSKVITGQVKP